MQQPSLYANSHGLIPTSSQALVQAPIGHAITVQEKLRLKTQRQSHWRHSSMCMTSVAQRHDMKHLQHTNYIDAGNVFKSNKWFELIWTEQQEQQYTVLVVYKKWRQPNWIQVLLQILSNYVNHDFALDSYMDKNVEG